MDLGVFIILVVKCTLTIGGMYAMYVSLTTLLSSVCQHYVLNVLHSSSDSVRHDDKSGLSVEIRK